MSALLLLLAFVSCGGGGGGSDGPPPPTATTSGATGITTSGATLSGIVDPNGHDTQAWFEWGTDPGLPDGAFSITPAQFFAAGSGVQPVFAPITGLAIGAPYYFRLAASNTAGESRGAIETFTITPIPPTVATSPATSITADGANLNGQVNPNGLAASAWFEWGTDPGLPDGAFSSTPLQFLAAGTIDQAVQAPLTGLAAGTTYYFRLAASNTAGENRGATETFTILETAPTVVTNSATGVTISGATLNGTVTTASGAASAWFRYGTSPLLTSFAETAKQPIGPGATNQAVSAALTTLASWKTFYFRIVAENVSNPGVLSLGEIRSFPTGEYYVAVGDSITVGQTLDDIFWDDTSLDGRNSGGGYEPVLNDLLTAGTGYPHTVENEGVSGATSADGAAAIGGVISRHPNAKYFLIMYGTNDATFPIPAIASGKLLNPGDPGYAGSYKDYMQRIVSAVISAGKTPYLAKVPFTSDPLRSDASIREYNDVIDELLFDNNIQVIPPDFYTHFLQNQDELITDGVHPNGIGYRSMATLWFEALTAP